VLVERVAQLIVERVSGRGPTDERWYSSLVFGGSSSRHNVLRAGLRREPAPRARPVAVSGTPRKARRPPRTRSTTFRSRRIQLLYGFFGERDDVEPSILWRPERHAGAVRRDLLNSAILYYLLIRSPRSRSRTRSTVAQTNILRGMEEAAHMKSELKPSSPAMSRASPTARQEIERVRLSCAPPVRVSASASWPRPQRSAPAMERDAQTTDRPRAEAPAKASSGEMVKSAAEVRREHAARENYRG